MLRSWIDQGVDLFALRHGGQIAATGGDQRAYRGTLINSFLQAAAGEESREVAGGEAVAGSDGVDRGDGEQAGLSGLPIGGPGLERPLRLA